VVLIFQGNESKKKRMNMKFRLFPRDEKFFDMFEAQTKTVLEGAMLIKELLDNMSRAAELAVKIKDKESEGDDITHKIIESLHRTFVTPIDREDIHNLASKLDDILDHMEAVSERIVLFKIDTAQDYARSFADVLIEAIEAISSAVGLLHDMRNSEKILEYCIEVNRLENVADGYLRSALADLFDGEYKTRDVMKWKEIYEHLENAVDDCEDAANVIEGAVLKYS
jgi:predicted phosphate transport protein (TIGR00153 family)